MHAPIKILKFFSIALAYKAHLSKMRTQHIQCNRSTWRNKIPCYPLFALQMSTRCICLLESCYAPIKIFNFFSIVLAYKASHYTASWVCKESLSRRLSYTSPIYFHCTDYMYKCKYKQSSQRLHIYISPPLAGLASLSEHQRTQDTQAVHR